MRVPHYAKRSFAALALTALVAGCGGDSTAPDAPFDPQGTSSDLGAMQASFESPAMSGYVAASGAISATLGESPAALAVRAVPTKALITGVKPISEIRPLVVAAAIPDEHLGVTFTYDVETGYGPSNLPGAPENGVRFMVYAIDPISGTPIEPLVEVGHADIVTTETASAATVRIELVSAGVTYLDYMVGATGGASALTLTVSGFVSNGDDRVNFDLDTHLTSTSVGVDYNLTVPTRGGFRIDFEGEGTGGTLTSTLEARGPHGTVTVSGTQTSASGTFDIEVNGELFATITKSGTEPPVITGADGEPLSQAELDALQAIAAVFLGGADFFEDLLDPIG